MQLLFVLFLRLCEPQEKTIERPVLLLVGFLCAALIQALPWNKICCKLFAVRVIYSGLTRSHYFTREDEPVSVHSPFHLLDGFIILQIVVKIKFCYQSIIVFGADSILGIK